MRDLFLGHGRFKDFAASPERIPTNILADRLEKLVLDGIAEQIPVGERSKRYAYRLTPKGDALRGVLKAMRNWGIEWVEGTQAARGRR